MKTINGAVRKVRVAFSLVIASSRGKWIAAGIIALFLLLFLIFPARSVWLPEAPQPGSALSEPAPTDQPNGSGQAIAVALATATPSFPPTQAAQAQIGSVPPYPVQESPTPVRSDSRPFGVGTFVVETPSATPQSPYHYSQVIRASFPLVNNDPSATPTRAQTDVGLQFYAAAGKVDVWAVVGKSVLHTTDHGQHWTGQFVAQGPITNLTFPDPLHGWLVANNGTVFTTQDGGAHWTQYQSSEPALKHVQALDFFSPKDGWAMGGVPPLPFYRMTGPAYLTSDGGKNWTRMKIDLAKQPFSDGPWNLPSCDWYKGSGAVNFTSVRTGWVVCPEYDGSTDRYGGAFFYRTTDGGASWTLGPSVPQVASRSVDDYGATGLYFMSDNMHGWYSSGVQFSDMPVETGATLLRATTDGGRTWRTVAVGDGTGALTELSFVSPAHGYARVWAYNHYPRAVALLETQDGGASWAPIYMGPDSRTRTTLFSPSNLRFFDAYNGIALGTEMAPGAIFTTSDAGARWHPANSIGSVCGSGVLAQIDDWSFPDPEHGWVLAGCLGSGDQGTSRVLARTTNGGRTWTLISPASSNEKITDQLVTISFFDASSGYASTDTEILVTRDGGVTFDRESTTNPWPILGGQLYNINHRMVFAERAEGWAIEPSRLSHTTDGGKSWQVLNADPFIQPLISVLPNGHAWICVGNRGIGDDEPDALLATSDGGMTWTRYELGSIIPTQISFSDMQHGWLLDTDGNFYRTEDGGTTWTTP